MHLAKSTESGSTKKATSSQFDTQFIVMLLGMTYLLSDGVLIYQYLQFWGRAVVSRQEWESKWIIFI